MSDTEIPKTVWPCVNYDDARAAISFLTDVLGFEARCAYPPEGDVVAHAELRWPQGGGVMLGSSGREESEFSQKPTGAASVYVVTDDPDPILARAEAAGTRVVRPMADEDYGSTGFAVADAEGNLWSFGTYRGE
jgi:uncharacterized glyoxalase superfamily protein PhnB